MIYLQWPSSSEWAIGTLVGVSMIISGVTRLMLSAAVCKVTAVVASSSPFKAACQVGALRAVYSEMRKTWEV